MNHKSESEVWVNGVFGAGVPADDPGLLFGLTVFETFRTYHGRPFRLREHLDRLVVSAAAMNIAIADVAIIEAQVLAICQGDVSIRYTVTAGGLAAMSGQSTDVRFSPK